MQMLRNFVGCDYSTDEGTDSEDEQVSGGEEHVGTGGEIKWIESEKGRPMLVCGGFSYYHHYDAKEKIDGVLTPVSVYHCVEYQSHCKAKVWIRDGNYHKRSTDGHNHCGDPIEVGSRVVRHKGKELLRANPLRPIGQVISKSIENQDEEVVADVDKENFRRELARERTKCFKLPKGRTDPMHLGIPTEWEVYDDGEPFILFDNGRCKDRVNTGAAEHTHDKDKCSERVIVISSRRMMEVFAKHSKNGRWAGDGTFYVKPGKKWSQLYGLHVEVEGRFVPCIAVLLGRANTATYLTMLQAIDEWIRLNMGVEWEPGVFFSDFELAIRSAIHRFFDGKVSHKCCYFHFYKAIIEHIGEAGLKEKYDEVPAFNMFVRSFPALALIHPDHIDAAFADIKERAKGFKGEGYEGMNKFMEYFEPTWIRKVNSRGIVTEALFPRKFWNHHDAALKDEAKTTCGLEEWHKDMKSAINKYPQKTLWYLLMHLKDQFGNVSPNRVIQLESPSQNKRLPKQKEQRAEILRKALNDFDPLDVKSSLVRVARASRYDDKKDPVPKRVGTKRHRAPDDDEEGWDDGGGDAAPTTLTAVRHMRL